jgi:acetylornithine deacetylase
MTDTIVKRTEERIASAVEALKKEMIEFIRLLVRTPSLPGEEKDVQQIVAAKLRTMNLDVDIIPIDLEKLEKHPAFSHDGVAPGKRMNVTGRWPGTGEPSADEAFTSRSLILNGHVDVVSPGRRELWDASPWSGLVKNGRIYGRGSADMKAGLSAAIFACQALQNLGFQPREDVIIQAVVGEETGGCGTLTNIINGCTADAAIIMEPTRLKIYPVQSGALSFRIRINGKPMHACLKNKGVSAVEKFYKVYDAVNEFECQRHARFVESTSISDLFEDPLNAAPINFGTVLAGDWPSTVPGELVTEGRFGIFPGESLAEAKLAFEKVVQQTARQDEWLRHHPPEIEWFEGQFESGRTSIDEPVVRVLSACHEAVLKEKVQLAGATYGADLRLFTNHAGIPALLYGPGDVMEAHTVNESIAISEIVQATTVLAFTILNWSMGREATLPPSSTK